MPDGRNGGILMKTKYFLLIPAIIILSFCMGGSDVFAKIPYPSYDYGPEGKPFRIQAPYKPVGVIGNNLYKKSQSGSFVKTKGLSNPEDIYIDKNNHIYVVDNYHNRVVEINNDGVLLQQFGTGKNPKTRLYSPEGVSVSNNGDVYVADTGHQRIAVYSPDGRFIKEYKKPAGPKVMFAPVHISLDSRGFLYVVLKGSNEGIEVLSPNGKYQGFLGTNLTQLSLLDRIKRKLYTKKQLETNGNKVSASVSDEAIGSDHYIYTCTEDVSTGQIKKLNIKGDNLFKKVKFSLDDPNLKKNGGMSISAITVDKNNYIYAIDKNNGRVFIYDNQGRALASFGTKLTGNHFRIGSFGNPASIAVNSQGMIYVSDQSYNGVQVFKPTEFMKEVFTANNLFNQGEYSKSLPYWKDILKKNVFYYRAHLALGEIYYENQQWAKAMSQFKLSKNQKLYSQAFWQLRVVWMQNHFTKFTLAFVVLCILLFILMRFKKKINGTRTRTKP